VAREKLSKAYHGDFNRAGSMFGAVVRYAMGGVSIAMPAGSWVEKKRERGVREACASTWHDAASPQL